MSDETGGNVVVIDPVSGQVVQTIAVGKRPRGIRLSRDGKQLLTALSGSPIAGPGVDESKLPPADRAADGIGVVELATHKVVRTYPSGQDPEVFDLSPDGATLYVSNEDAAQMSIVDLAAGTVASRVAVGEEPEGVTVSPDGREVWSRARETIGRRCRRLHQEGGVQDEDGARPRLSSSAPTESWRSSRTRMTQR